MSIRIKNTLNVASSAVVDVNVSILKQRPYSTSQLVVTEAKIPVVKNSEVLDQYMVSFLSQMRQRVHPGKLIATRNGLFFCLMHQRSFHKLNRQQLKLTLSLLPASDLVNLPAQSLRALEIFVPEQRGKLQALCAWGYLRRNDQSALLLQLTRERESLKKLDFWLAMDEKLCLSFLNASVSSECLAKMLGVRPLALQQFGDFKIADFILQPEITEKLNTAAVIMGWSIKAQAKVRLAKEKNLDKIVASVESKGLINSMQELKNLVKTELSQPGLFHCRENISKLYLPLLLCFNQELSRIERSIEKLHREAHLVKDIERSMAGKNIKGNLKRLFLIGDIFKGVFPFGPDFSRLRFIAKKLGQ